MLKEFKEFVSRGNVMDLAVAVVIGGAFGKIVTSFVNDILMPPIGLCRKAPECCRHSAKNLSAAASAP